jgi:hypothetical protein
LGAQQLHVAMARCAEAAWWPRGSLPSPSPATAWHPPVPSLPARTGCGGSLSGLLQSRKRAQSSLLDVVYMRQGGRLTAAAPSALEHRARTARYQSSKKEPDAAGKGWNMNRTTHHSHKVLGLRIRQVGAADPLDAAGGQGAGHRQLAGLQGSSRTRVPLLRETGCRVGGFCAPKSNRCGLWLRPERLQQW